MVLCSPFRPSRFLCCPGSPGSDRAWAKRNTALPSNRKAIYAYALKRESNETLENTAKIIRWFSMDLSESVSESIPKCQHESM